MQETLPGLERLLAMEALAAAFVPFSSLPQGLDALVLAEKMALWLESNDTERLREIMNLLRTTCATPGLDIWMHRIGVRPEAASRTLILLTRDVETDIYSVTVSTQHEDGHTLEAVLGCETTLPFLNAHPEK